MKTVDNSDEEALVAALLVQALTRHGWKVSEKLLLKLTIAIAIDLDLCVNTSTILSVLDSLVRVSYLSRSVWESEPSQAWIDFA